MIVDWTEADLIESLQAIVIKRAGLKKIEQWYFNEKLQGHFWLLNKNETYAWMDCSQ